MKYVILILFFIALFFIMLIATSCTTTKYIDREKVVVDSSVVEQNLALQRTLHETVERHEKEKEQWEKTGITFYDSNGERQITMPGDTFRFPFNATSKYEGFSRLPETKITFEDGKLKSVEGPVKSFNQNKYAKSSELSDARSTIDSMKAELAKKETKLLKETVTIRKNIKTKFFPGWAYFLIPVIFLLGSIVESKLKYMARIFSLLKI